MGGAIMTTKQEVVDMLVANGWLHSRGRLVKTCTSVRHNRTVNNNVQHVITFDHGRSRCMLHARNDYGLQYCAVYHYADIKVLSNGLLCFGKWEIGNFKINRFFCGIPEEWREHYRVFKVKKDHVPKQLSNTQIPCVNNLK